MAAKKILGLGVLIMGAGFVVYAIGLMQNTHEAKQNVSKVASSDREEPLGAIIGDVLTKKVSENDSTQAYLLMGGMAVLIGGGGIVLLFRNRN